MTPTILSSLLTASSETSNSNGEPTLASVLVAYSPPVVEIAKAEGTGTENDDDEEDDKEDDDEKDDKEDDDPIVPPN